VKDFWRRWHISLSSWFRDYLYIPLGGNRGSEGRTYFNLILVFFLCGLWHGASWTFAIWGLYHGVFLVLERTRFGALVDRLPRPARHLYTLLAVMFGWVLFRADTFPQALAFMSNMIGLSTTGESAQPLQRYISQQVIFALVAGVLFSTPLWPWLKERLTRGLGVMPEKIRPVAHAAGLVLEPVLVIALLVISAAWLAGSTYNPFIYFRF
jgi:alginate O-acetyltransferase complex protein AlgI